MPGFSLISASGLVEPCKYAWSTKYPTLSVGILTPAKRFAWLKRQLEPTVFAGWAPQKPTSKSPELKDRAAYRFANEEMTKQLNMEGSITDKAIPRLNSDASPDSMENDWITNFFDKCRTVSDDDMQELWGRILAGEANTPNSFSRRTVNLVADLDKRDAELLTRLCAFGWMIGGLTPLVFDFRADIYNRNGIAFDTLGPT